MLSNCDIDLPAPSRRRLGVMFDREAPPEHLAGFCQRLDSLDVDDLWVVEDLGWTSSVALAATALAASLRLRIGIGIAPAPLRNPVLLAMELATLARIYPDRLIAGVGHGISLWMDQVTFPPRSKLLLLEQTVSAIRLLLKGETVTIKSDVLHLDQVRLVRPPSIAPPILMGVLKARSMELSGRVAEGTVLAEGTTPEAVVRAREYIKDGRRDAVVSDPHEIVVYVHVFVHSDPNCVRSRMAPIIVEFATLQGVKPADNLVAAGNSSAVAERITALWEAGADTVVLRPVGEDPMHHIEAALCALGR